jgi:hypothetical protein
VSISFYTATHCIPLTKLNLGVDHPIEQVNRSAIRLENDAGDDGTSDTTEELTHAPPNGPTAPRPQYRQSYVFRLGSAFEKLGRWLKDSADNDEDFTRNIRLVYTAPDQDDISREAVAEIDTKSPGDYVSVRLVRQLLGIDYSIRPRTRVATTLQHGEIHSVGEITLRWTARNNKRGWVLGMPSFSPRYYTTTFEVIDTTEFDVILGRACINKYKLLKLDNRIFGMYEAHRPAISTRMFKLSFRRLNVTDYVDIATNVAEVQRQATARRENAEQRRQRADAQSVSCLCSCEG